LTISRHRQVQKQSKKQSPSCQSGFQNRFQFKKVVPTVTGLPATSPWTNRITTRQQ
jgi:hypothetical protein